MWKLFFFIFIFYQSGFCSTGGLAEPYLGYGAGTLRLGEQQWVDGTSQGFILGLKLGWNMTENILLAVDACQEGPFAYQLRDGDQLFFQLGSVGVGLGLQASAVQFWGGWYFYERLDEMSRNFAYRGVSALKVALGISVYADMRLSISYEQHNLQPWDVSGSVRSSICGSADCDAKAQVSLTAVTLSTPL